MEGKKNTRFDNLIEAIKNNKFLAIIILVGVIIAGIASFTDSLQKIYVMFSDGADNDLAVNISVLNDTLDIDEETFGYDKIKEVFLRYDIVNRKDSLFIEPKMPYLSKIENHTPISPISMFEMADPLPLPTIDLKIVNNTESTIYFTESVFVVTESKTDPWPLLIIDGACEEMRIPICNIGWGDVYDFRIEYNIIKPTETPNYDIPYKYKMNLGQFSTRESIDLRNAFSQEGVDVRTLNMGWDNTGSDKDGNIIYYYTDNNGQRYSLPLTEACERIYIALGPFSENDRTERNSGKAIVYGEISFSGILTNGESKNETIRFATDVSLFRWGSKGAGIAVDGEYQLELDTDRENYSKNVSISQALKSGEADRFTLTIKSSKSSVHKFRILLKYNDGKTYESEPIELKIFVPNYMF